jgi:hypothetical protein
MINLKIGIGIDVDNENGDNVDNPNFNTQWFLYRDVLLFGAFLYGVF